VNDTHGPGALDSSDVGGLTIANTTVLSTRKIMAYASGINDLNPAYFDDTTKDGLSVHPAIAFSLQWNSRFTPDRLPNHRAAPFGVHAATDLSIYQPFVQDEAITIQGQMIKRHLIRPGVYTVDRYKMTNGKGTLVAELDYISITRGASLEGENQSIAEEKPRPKNSSLPATPVWEESVDIPLSAGQQYTECANIYNPIHTEKSVAIKAGLADIILHGSATKAIALSKIINHCFDADPRRITRLCGELRAMVLMNTSIRIQCLSTEDKGHDRIIHFKVLNQNGDLAIANGIVMGRM
jgi:hypothetical protein